MKRLFILMAIAFVMLSAVACTREKPAPPAPSLVALAFTPSPVPTTPAPISSPAAPTPVILPTPAVTPLPLATPAVVATAPLTPTVSPAGLTPTSPAGLTPASLPGTYTVQWGDWLNKIAQRFGITTQALLAANPGINPNRIYPGQVLKIPDSGAPGPTPAPGAPTPTTPSGPTTYTVQRGEWFYAIARKFGVSVPALQAANPGVNPNLLSPGQVLNIPASGSTPPSPPSGQATSYVVQRGDTLASIAVRFHTTVYALQFANHLPNPNAIYPGQTLIIPP